MGQGERAGQWAWFAIGLGAIAGLIVGAMLGGFPGALVGLAPSASAHAYFGREFSREGAVRRALLAPAVLIGVAVLYDWWSIRVRF